MPDPVSMTVLAAQLEEMQVALVEPALCSAVAALHEGGWISDEAYHQAHRMIRVGAFTSAAEQLLPTAALWRVGHDGQGPDPSVFKAEFFAGAESGRREVNTIGRADHPALALAAACTRAAGLWRT